MILLRSGPQSYRSLDHNRAESSGSDITEVSTVSLPKSGPWCDRGLCRGLTEVVSEDENDVRLIGGENSRDATDQEQRQRRGYIQERAHGATERPTARQAISTTDGQARPHGLS